MSASGTWSRCFEAYSLRATLPGSVREIGFDGSNAGRMTPLVHWTLFWQALLFSRDTACHRSRRRSVTAFSRASARCRMQHDRKYVLDHAGNLHPAARSRQRTLACRRAKFVAAHHLPQGHRDGHHRGRQSSPSRPQDRLSHTGEGGRFIMLATDASTFSHWLVVVTTEQGFPYWRAPAGTADFGHTKSGSHPTLRWRKADSNSWSHFEKSRPSQDTPQRFRVVRPARAAPLRGSKS